jgi:hypothetical protein
MPADASVKIATETFAAGLSASQFSFRCRKPAQVAKNPAYLNVPGFPFRLATPPFLRVGS